MQVWFISSWLIPLDFQNTLSTWQHLLGLFLVVWVFRLKIIFQFLHKELFVSTLIECLSSEPTENLTVISQLSALTHFSFRPTAFTQRQCISVYRINYILRVIMANRFIVVFLWQSTTQSWYKTMKKISLLSHNFEDRALFSTVR